MAPIEWSLCSGQSWSTNSTPKAQEKESLSYGFSKSHKGFLVYYAQRVVLGYQNQIGPLCHNNEVLF